MTISEEAAKYIKNQPVEKQNIVMVKSAIAAGKRTIVEIAEHVKANCRYPEHLSGKSLDTLKGEIPRSLKALNKYYIDCVWAKNGKMESLALRTMKVLKEVDIIPIIEEVIKSKGEKETGNTDATKINLEILLFELASRAEFPYDFDSIKDAVRLVYDGRDRDYKTPQLFVYSAGKIEKRTVNVVNETAPVVNYGIDINSINNMIDDINKKKEVCHQKAISLKKELAAIINEANIKYAKLIAEQQKNVDTLSETENGYYIVKNDLIRKKQ